MTQNISDQAQLLAEGLGIDPSSYTGQEEGAVIAMTLIAGYRRMAPTDQTQMLYRIDELRLGPAFLAQCRTALAMMTVNPVWVPGSLSNGELEAEIDLWRGVSKVLTTLGFATGLGAFVSGKGKSVFDRAISGKPITKEIFSPKAIASTSASMLGYAAQSVAQQSIADLGAEATRRGQLGTMTPLNAGRYGATK